MTEPGVGKVEGEAVEPEAMGKAAFEADPMNPEAGGRRKVLRDATMLPAKDLDEQRNGTWISCTGHIITAVIGSGVLYLPFFFDILGWIGGTIMVFSFGAITWYTSRLLADAMVIDGVRYRTYQSAVEAVFGRRGGIILACVQYPNLILTAIAYNITGANSMISFSSTFTSFSDTYMCNEKDELGYCTDVKTWVFSVIFGGCQLFLSQMPNLDSAAWASYVGAIMSFGYSLLSLGMSIYQIAHYGASDTTSVTGYPLDPPAPYEPISVSQKVFDVFNAFGGIVFAFSFSFILIEISDTLKDAGRGPVWHMKRSVTVSVAIITSFYVLVSILGYIAYGDDLYSQAYIINLWINPDNSGTTNVARVANIMVLVHMLPAYQVFSQPVFSEVERLIRHKKSGIMAKMGKWGFRIAFRSTYVCIVCFIAILLPFFGDFVGLIGALGFWPATVLFPIEMYRRIHKPNKKMTFWLETLNLVCLLITIAAIIGSVQLIVQSASNYKIF